MVFELSQEPLAKVNRETDRTLSSDQQSELLQLLGDGWTIGHHADEPCVSKEFTFDNFKQAMVFVDAVADLAEQFNHHPLISVTWGKATVDWWTHSLGGLHRNDFIMAAKTDTLYRK